jgi:hypothetical protein
MSGVVTISGTSKTYESYHYNVEWDYSEKCYIASCVEMKSLRVNSETPHGAITEMCVLVQSCLNEMTADQLAML